VSVAAEAFILESVTVMKDISFTRYSFVAISQATQGSM